VANRNALPWQTLAAGGAIGSSLGGALGQQYQNAYNASLGMNAALFDRVQTGYDDLRSQVSDQYGDILAGYQTHYGDVLGRIAGSNETNINDINTQYAANAGNSMQSAVSRGFGNSTVQQNMQRGIDLDRARAVTDSQNRFAQLGANYANQIGLTRLGAQQQGVQMGAGIGQAQLGALERVNIPYPDIGTYAQMAQMQGANAARNGAGNRVPLAQPAIQASPGVSRPPSPFGSRDPTGGGYSTGNLTQPGGGYSYAPNSFFGGGSGGGGGGSFGGSSGNFFGGGGGSYGGGGLLGDYDFNNLIGVDESWWYDTDVNQGWGQDSGFYGGDYFFGGLYGNGEFDQYAIDQGYYDPALDVWGVDTFVPDGAYDPVYDAWDIYADPFSGFGGYDSGWYDSGYDSGGGSWDSGLGWDTYDTGGGYDYSGGGGGGGGDWYDGDFSEFF
jgi:hypothetical protein